MKFAPTLGFGVALLSAGLAFAQPATPPAGPNAAARGERGDRGARMFQMFDTNTDGRITWDESWTFATTRFTAADADRSGGLSLQEFSAMRMGRANAPTPPAEHAARMEQRRGMMFRSIDANRDGQVTLDEMRPFAEARFRGMDANADGAVTREEMPARGGHHRGGHHHGGPRGDAPSR